LIVARVCLDCPGMGGLSSCVLRLDRAVEGDRRIPYTPTNDVELVEFFIKHHQMAIHHSTALPTSHRAKPHVTDVRASRFGRRHVR
jgi:hypothetical protein